MHSNKYKNTINTSITQPISKLSTLNKNPPKNFNKNPKSFTAVKMNKQNTYHALKFSIKTLSSYKSEINIPYKQHETRNLFNSTDFET